MYDIKKRVIMHHVTIGSMIDALSKYPRDAKVCCCGDDLMFIHVEHDDSVVNIDTEELDDAYIDDDDTSPDAYWKNRKGTEDVDGDVAITKETRERLLANPIINTTGW